MSSVIELLDRPIAFQRAFVDLGIGITGALMLSQCVYWAKRTSNTDGWFYKSQAEWERETGMTRREQETARKRLVKAGFLEECRKGVPARLFYRIDTEALEAALKELSSRMAESANQECTKRATSLSQEDKQECTESPISDGWKRQSITEITTETTAEITAENASGPDRPDEISTRTEDSLPTTRENQDRPDAAIQSGRFWGTAVDLELAEWMWDSLAEQLGGDKPRAPNIARWANDVRLMRQQDNRDPRHIRALYAWCRQHSFWAANIQSPAKLREKWSQLAAQRNRERESVAGGSPGGRVSRERALELRNQQAVQEFLNGGGV